MNKKLLVTAIGLMFSVFTTGCVRPYNAPKFVDIGTNETAYVIPLQGNTVAQAKFDSAAFLDQRKVAAKRIEIPRNWVQNGYVPGSGYYQDGVMVLKVDRTPVTREFHQDKDKDADAIWIESRDSVGFSTGFTVTAMIHEEDASTFLYRYQQKSLANVLDTEVRARIQTVAANFAATDILDNLRSKKNDLIAAVRTDVIPFFAERGITITTIGQFGGWTYENPKIQDSIDNTFVSQQQKVVAAAILEAQRDINAKSESEQKQFALNVATKAAAEAGAITAVANAAKEAASNPAFMRLRELEVESKRIERWNGITPSTLIESGGGSSGLNMFLNTASK